MTRNLRTSNLIASAFAAALAALPAVASAQTIPLDVAAGYMGRLAEPFKTGALYDVFAGKRLASHADLVARYYTGLNHYVGQGIFVGIGLHV